MKYKSVLVITANNEPKYVSGDNAELYNQFMNEMYKGKFGTTFDHIDCFEILHLEPKWEEYLNLQQEKQVKKSERKECPTGTKKFKKQQEEKELIKTCMKEAGLHGTGENPIVLEGITDTHAGNGNGRVSPKDQHLADVSESFKQIASIVPQLLWDSWQVATKIILLPSFPMKFIMDLLYPRHIFKLLRWKSR
jgi:hypothetical protein